MFFWKGGSEEEEENDNQKKESMKEDTQKAINAIQQMSILPKNDQEEEEEDAFVCEEGKNLDDCELEVIRQAVEKSEQKVGRRKMKSPETQEMISILEDFLRRKKLICYGGIALNNILPEDDQFYEFDIEIPDYDFFSTTPDQDAIELADIYAARGFENVEAKSGQHIGTFKVFVDFTGIADITELPESIFQVLQKEAIEKDGILYTPPNFLRMSIFNELSSTEGDTSRYEKIFKRLRLLNKYYPIAEINCEAISYERKMEDSTYREIIYKTLFEVFVEEEVVFMGGFAMKQFVKYMKKDVQKRLNATDEEEQNPDFDVIANNPEKVMEHLRTAFARASSDIHISFVKHPEIGEVLQDNWAIIIGEDAVGFIYQSSDCKSYNVIKMPSITNPNKQVFVKIASIDTMLKYYFTFIFINKPYYDHNRIMCMANFLWQVQQQNRLSQKGILKRFPMKCYGHQKTIEEMKSEKSRIYKKYEKTNRNHPLFQKAFFKYAPGNEHNNNNKSHPPPPKHQQQHQKQQPQQQQNAFYSPFSSVFSSVFSSSSSPVTRKNSSFSPSYKRGRKNRMFSRRNQPSFPAAPPVGDNESLYSSYLSSRNPKQSAKQRPSLSPSPPSSSSSSSFFGLKLPFFS